LCVAAEVLSEEVILKWYKDGHVPKGWTVYGEQMKKFVDWLEHAESGKFHLSKSYVTVYLNFPVLTFDLISGFSPEFF
jgi:hypothetical protein